MGSLRDFCSIKSLVRDLILIFPSKNLFILILRDVSFVDLYSFFYKSVYNRGIFVTLTCIRFLSSVFCLLHPSNIGDYIFFPVFLPPCFLSSHFLSSPIFLSSKHTLRYSLSLLLNCGCAFAISLALFLLMI